MDVAIIRGDLGDDFQDCIFRSISVNTCHQVLSGATGFRLWLQLMHCAYLLTLSEYFEWGRTFGLWMKSKASLHMGEAR